MASASQECLQSGPITLPDPIPQSFIEEITNYFKSEELGGSVFGKVYKGTLRDGKMVCVKKLDENSPVADDKAFVAEVANLMARKHKNIAELLGSCEETRKQVIQHNGRYVTVDITGRFLCYEYLPKGSLDNYIYGELLASAETDDKIDWDKRFKIIKGICQGLHFLHVELPIGPLVHMNIVPNTIWLDHKWEPKIADFGLSRVFGLEKTRMNTVHVLGYYGYMAPEYLYRGEISTKSDIYSLGMLIMEITTGQKICANDADKSARSFVEKVQQDWKRDDQIISKYPSLGPKRLQQVKACIAIGLKCVDATREKRPSIVDIVNKLKGNHVPCFDES